MLTIVTGVGYTGKRILDGLPDAIGLSRTAIVSDHDFGILDLDIDKTLPIAPIALAEPYRVIYTIPPGGESGDDRLSRFLQFLQPTPTRFVYISTTGVYGDCKGEQVDEAAVTRPRTDRAKRRVWAEEKLNGWSEDNDCELVILRVPGIYGPGRLGEARLQNQEPILDEASAHPGNRIHVDDLVACCIAALSAPPGIYNVGDGDHQSSTWFATEVANQLGLPMPPQISRAEAEHLLSRERLSFLSEPRRIDTHKMREVLGVSPRYADPRDGIKASHKTR